MSKKMTAVISDEDFEEIQDFISSPQKHSDFDVYCMFDYLMAWANFEDCEPPRIEAWWLEERDGVWGESNGKVFKPIEFSIIQEAIVQEKIKEAVKQYDRR